MTSETYIKVDDLLPNVSLPQIVAYYGAVLPELLRVGEETRMPCFLACGKTEETGTRAIAIREGIAPYAAGFR